MKEILFWKYIDLLSQIAAVFYALIAYHSLPASDDLSYVIYYICIGGSQLLSFLVNKFAIDKEHKIQGRYWYGYTLLMVIFIFIFGCIDVRILFFLLMGALYVTPALALWYWAITIWEIVKMTRKIKEANIDNKQPGK